jgi:hypothetical protein
MSRERELLRQVYENCNLGLLNNIVGEFLAELVQEPEPFAWVKYSSDGRLLNYSIYQGKPEGAYKLYTTPPDAAKRIAELEGRLEEFIAAYDYEEANKIVEHLIAENASLSAQLSDMHILNDNLTHSNLLISEELELREAQLAKIREPLSDEEIYKAVKYRYSNHSNQNYIVACEHLTARDFHRAILARIEEET